MTNDVAPLPCPFCGCTEVQLKAGSTYRWAAMACVDCGAQCGEVRGHPADAQTAEIAIVEWNKRAAASPKSFLPGEPPHCSTCSCGASVEPRSEHTCEGTCDTPRLCRVSQECLFVRYVKNRPATAPDCTSNGSQALCSAWPTCRCGRAGAEHVKALKLIRDGAIPQGMSAALFADCVLGVPPENRPAPHE